MEVFLYNSTVCRLCGEENDNGTLLYSREENNEDLSEVINAYLPIKVSDDGQLPRTICPGCTIQLEATVEFLNLIINGQKVIREIHQREKEYKKSLINKPAEQQIITENIVYEVNTSTGVYKVEHPIALQVGGLDRPKRKRGRPPKKQKTPEELAQETSLKEQIKKTDIKDDKDEEINGKRRRKTPYRFKEVVQGKELERIFKEEGVTDAEDSDQDIKIVEDTAPKVPVSKEPEVIGHMENSGELVFVVKGKGRGRPKGRMRPTHEKCAICGKEFFSVGRYMSHVAQHGPVTYQCEACSQLFTTLINFKEHQTQTGHEGQNVLPSQKENEPKGKSSPNKDNEPKVEDPLDIKCKRSNNTITPDELPILDHQPIGDVKDIKNEDDKLKSAKEEPSSDDNKPEKNGGVIQVTLSPEKSVDANETNEKAPIKLKCPLCDKLFSSKQSRSMHLKATHNGERPYACAECGAKFAYPRSLALHAISHRKHRGAKGYACDLCGKVLNHPSSVVYHKQAEHAGTRFVCNTCGKCFRHKQLLRKHQLVHSQLRPFTCKTCNSTFKTKANLLNHQLLHSGVKKFSCELCKHKFAHKTSLTLHMRWHTGQKPYSCQICGKSFSQKGNLSEHERIHTGEKPFECEHCLRRFTTSSQHRLHLRRHSADKPYACPNCPKRFTTHSSWSAHVRREAGALPQRCGVCARAFADKWTLQKHARLHTGERPFRCPHCPRLFADNSNLNKHKKQVHKQVSLLASANQAHSQISQQGEVSPELVQQVLQQVVQTPKSVVKTVNSRIVPQVVANPIAISPKPVPKVEEQPEERVIYFTYDVEDEDSPAYHILDPEEATNVEESRLVTTCALYSGESLLVPRQELVLQNQEEEEEILQEDPDDIPHHIVVETTPQHIPVTDEEGNPLQFTMQDGTKLAITSVDGKSLQVVTQDGQTIPIEINGFSEEDNSTKYIVSSLCM